MWLDPFSSREESWNPVQLARRARTVQNEHVVSLSADRCVGRWRTVLLGIVRNSLIDAATSTRPSSHP
jgi:hypothetical protein